MQLLQIAAEFIICNTLKWVRKKIEFGVSHCDAVILWRKTTRFAPKFDMKSKKQHRLPPNLSTSNRGQ